jgi:hypothetical protein
MIDSHTSFPSPTASAAAMDVRVGSTWLLRPCGRGISQ